MAAQRKTKRSKSRERRRLVWWKKLLFAAVVVVLFFALLEAALWLAGVQTISATEDPYVGFAGSAPLFVAETQPDGRVLMTTAPNKLAWFNHQQFPPQKPSGTRRVFCLGGSTTYGRPYDDATSFSAYLRELLPSAAPDSRWEVINAGGVSYAGYRVAALMEELAQYEPDLFVVYTGHNEFLEERTYGELRDKPAALLETASLLGRTRTYTLMRSLLAPKPPPKSRAMLPGEVDAALDRSVGPSSYHRDDKLHAQVLAHFELNLARMARIARDCGAKIVFVVPAANLKDCSPFKSEHAAGLSDAELARWNAQYEAAQSLADEGQWDEALAKYEAAATIDERFADLQFRLGGVLLALNRPVEAGPHFERAVDEDVCPLRAPRSFRQAVRDLCTEHNIPLIDFELIVKNDCLAHHGHNIPGNEYFLDHVHPTLDGHKLLALHILSEMREADVFPGMQQPTGDEVEQAERRIQARIDRRAHAIAERNLAKVLNWAGKHEEAGRLAIKSLEVLPDDPESLVIGGAWLKSHGRLDEAIEHLQRAVEQMPDYPSARQLLGAFLVEVERYDEAREQFLAVAKQHPQDAEAWQMVGAILAEREQYADALPYYEQALKLAPNDANLHYNYGLVLFRLGRHADAEDHFRTAIKQNAGDLEARYQLAQLLIETNRTDQARSDLRELLRRDPGHQAARQTLNELDE
jgi:tetratricopeptide (TPR) repeat protein